MAGLVPAIHAGHPNAMRGGWVYIMTNRPDGTLYTGLTNEISRRAYEHRTGLYQGFTKQYGLTRLVYIERYEDIRRRSERTQHEALARVRGKSA